MHVSSLVPRPSHCPVFDPLQYAKTEGSVSTRGGRLYLVVSAPSATVSNIYEVKSTPLLVQLLPVQNKKACAKCILSMEDPSTLLSIYL